MFINLQRVEKWKQFSQTFAFGVIAAIVCDFYKYTIYIANDIDWKFIVD